ncbi:MAG: hypothetical protein ACKOB5_03825, partial [Betaproteobacteria bacterium]
PKIKVSNSHTLWLTAAKSEQPVLEDPELARGSVRARSDASTVEDLIQHRLSSIMQDLRIQSMQFQQDEAQIQQSVQGQGDHA